jgi:hypothetical protein
MRIKALATDGLWPIPVPSVLTPWRGVLGGTFLLTTNYGTVLRTYDPTWAIRLRLSAMQAAIGRDINVSAVVVDPGSKVLAELEETPSFAEPSILCTAQLVLRPR